MTMTRAAALLVSIGASLTAVGCGDDKPSGFRTGVDGSKTIGTATPAEAEQICRSTETWARAQLADSKQRELACRIEALGAAASGLLAPGANPTVMPAQLQTTCRATLDQCLAAGAPSAMPSMAACPSFPPTCTATVAEYEACLNDVPPFVDKSAASLPTCETLNPVSLLALASLVSTAPASCQTFQMKCGVAGIPGIPGIPGAPRGTLTPRP
jgi:hypothetical protein